MLEFDEAQSRLTEAAPFPTRVETVPLVQAAGRVLAVELTATVDLPPADNSAMDGYAIRHADYRPGVAMPIQQRSYAGEQPQPLTLVLGDSQPHRIRVETEHRVQGDVVEPDRSGSEHGRPRG